MDDVERLSRVLRPTPRFAWIGSIGFGFAVTSIIAPFFQGPVATTLYCFLLGLPLMCIAPFATRKWHAFGASHWVKLFGVSLFSWWFICSFAMRFFDREADFAKIFWLGGGYAVLAALVPTTMFAKALRLLAEREGRFLRAADRARGALGLLVMAAGGMGALCSPLVTRESRLFCLLGACIAIVLGVVLFDLSWRRKRTRDELLERAENGNLSEMVVDKTRSTDCLLRVRNGDVGYRIAPSDPEVLLEWTADGDVSPVKPATPPRRDE